MPFGNKRMVSAENLLRTSTSKNNLCSSPVHRESRADGLPLLLPPQPNCLLDLGRDVLDLMASFSHPLDLGRLSLCSRELLREVEASAKGLSERHCLHSRIGLLAQPGSSYWTRSNGTARSWRYRYLMLVEVALVDNDMLRTTLANIYFKDDNNGPMDRLNLYGLDIGDEGAAHLALALRVSKEHRVDSINLCRNNISDAGARTLIEAVCRHHEINSLSLSQNRIGADGAQCIAELIRHSANLKNLSLSENPLTDDGARVIAGALQNGSSLRTLSMRSVHLSVNVREDLRGLWGGSHKSAIWGLYL